MGENGTVIDGKEEKRVSLWGEPRDEGRLVACRRGQRRSAPAKEERDGKGEGSSVKGGRSANQRGREREGRGCSGSPRGMAVAAPKCRVGFFGEF